MKSSAYLLILSLLFVCVGPVSASGGDKNAALYNEVVLEFAKFMNPKNMEKPWKKRGEAWKGAVKKSNSVEILSALVAEFEANVRESAVLEAWGTRRSAWNSDVKSCKSYADLGDYLVEMEEGISIESKLDGWDDAREPWLDDITESGQKLKISAEKIEYDAEGMRSLFDQIWAGTTNSFQEIKTGDATAVPNLGNVFLARLKMPQAKSSRVVQVVEEDSDNWRFMAIFDAGQYEENATALLAEIAAALDGIMPAGFPRQSDFLQGYVNTEILVWEVQDEDFNVVARKPSVSLGLLESNGQYRIELEISEPVFR
jgi:hypothetical protein